MQVTEGDSLFKGQSGEDICTDYMASNSTAHVHCSSLGRLNTDKETAGLVMASQPCHEGISRCFWKSKSPLTIDCVSMIGDFAYWPVRCSGVENIMVNCALQLKTALSPSTTRGMA